MPVIPAPALGGDGGGGVLLLGLFEPLGEPGLVHAGEGGGADHPALEPHGQREVLLDRLAHARGGEAGELLRGAVAVHQALEVGERGGTLRLVPVLHVRHPDERRADGLGHDALLLAEGHRRLGRGGGALRTRDRGEQVVATTDPLDRLGRLGAVDDLVAGLVATVRHAGASLRGLAGGLLVGHGLPSVGASSGFPMTITSIIA